jgi:hypothetical protein
VIVYVRLTKLLAKIAIHVKSRPLDTLIVKIACVTQQGLQMNFVMKSMEHVIADHMLLAPNVMNVKLDITASLTVNLVYVMLMAV